MPQGFNGIQACGFVRGDVAKHDTDRCGEKKRQQDDTAVKDQRHLQGVGNEIGGYQGHQDADNAAEGGEHDGLTRNCRLLSSLF